MATRHLRAQSDGESGKVLRRSIQALAEMSDRGDLTTIEDASGLEEIRRVLH